jgi:polyhydroxyalkanoate synthesis regulator phasin
MVVATGKMSQESFLKYMRAIFEMYQNTYRGFTHAMPQFDFLQMMLPPGAKHAEIQQASPEASEVSELRRRIDKLEKHIASSAAKKRKRRPRTARRK